MQRWRDGERDVWVIAARSDADWPTPVPWTCASIVLLVAVDRAFDATGLARAAIPDGVAAMAAWGPACDQLEHQFDEVIVFELDEAETEHGVIMTTQHADDTLDDAFEFFADVLFPARHVDGQTVWVAFALGDLAPRIEALLEARGARRA